MTSASVCRFEEKKEAGYNQTTTSSVDDKIDELAARLFRIYSTPFYDNRIGDFQTCTQRLWRFADWLDRTIKKNSFHGLFASYSLKTRDLNLFSKAEEPNIYRSNKSGKLFIDKTSRCQTFSKGYFTVFERFLVREYLSYIIRIMNFKYIKVPRKYLVRDTKQVKTQEQKCSPIPLVKGLRLYSERIEDDAKVKSISLEVMTEIIQFCVVANYCDIQVRMGKNWDNFHLLKPNLVYVIDTDLKSITGEVHVTEKISRFKSLIEQKDQSAFDELLRRYQRFYSGSST